MSRKPDKPAKKSSQASRLHGIDYIDRRTLDILFGIYRRESFIVYGD